MPTRAELEEQLNKRITDTTKHNITRLEYQISQNTQRLDYSEQASRLGSLRHLPLRTIDTNGHVSIIEQNYSTAVTGISEAIGSGYFRPNGDIVFLFIRQLPNEPLFFGTWEAEGNVLGQTHWGPLYQDEPQLESQPWGIYTIPTPT